MPSSRAQTHLTRPGLSDWFIKHPIGTTLLTVGIVLLGIVAFPLLPVAPMPEAELPTMQINAGLPGASPETMASAVATPLEVQLSSVPGISEMTSTSSLGSTQITLQFVLNKDIDVAAQEVQAAINAASGRLPSDLPNLPTWRKVNPNDSPILVVRMQSELMTLEELSDIAETTIARQLSQIDGVAEIPINGQRKPAMRIQASPEKLASLGLTLADLRQSIQEASVNQAKGALFGADRVSTLQTNDQIFTPEDYDNLIVAYRDNAPVFLRDVAKVTFGAENEYVQAWQNGKPGIMFIIRRQPGANIVATADRIREALPHLRELLPASVELEVINDRTRTIRASLHEVEVTLIVTVLLVVVVMGVFLRQLSATAIVASVLAVALITTVGAMCLLGFSLNNLTLVALVVAVGFVVDDAIVVVENIHRHLEAGESVLDAARQGAAEIGFTVVSISFSLIAAFVPLLFMGGVVGRLFREFAVTMTVAILISHETPGCSARSRRSCAGPATSRVSEKVVLRESTSTSPDCSAGEALLGVQGTHLTLLASPSTLAATALQTSTSSAGPGAVAVGRGEARQADVHAADDLAARLDGIQCLAGVGGRHRSKGEAGGSQRGKSMFFGDFDHGILQSVKLL